MLSQTNNGVIMSNMDNKKVDFPINTTPLLVLDIYQDRVDVSATAYTKEVFTNITIEDTVKLLLNVCALSINNLYEHAKNEMAEISLKEANLYRDDLAEVYAQVLVYVDTEDNLSVDLTSGKLADENTKVSQFYLSCYSLLFDLAQRSEDD